MASYECTVSRVVCGCLLIATVSHVGHSGTATSSPPPACQLLKHNLLYDVATHVPALANYSVAK